MSVCIHPWQGILDCVRVDRKSWALQAAVAHLFSALACGCNVTTCCRVLLPCLSYNDGLSPGLRGNKPFLHKSRCFIETTGNETKEPDWATGCRWLTLTLGQVLKGIFREYQAKPNQTTTTKTGEEGKKKYLKEGRKSPKNRRNTYKKQSNSVRQVLLD